MHEGGGGGGGLQAFLFQLPEVIILSRYDELSAAGGVRGGVGSSS